MKKIMIGFIIVLSVTLIGCSNLNNGDNDLAFSQDTIATKIATSIYLSQGLLEADSTSENMSLKLSEHQEPQIDSRMNQMMVYFERVNIFIGSTESQALNIETNDSTNEDYDYHVTYQFEGQTYDIFYNIIESDEENQMFDLEGILEINDMSYEIIGGTEVEGGETELFFETYGMNDDYVRVEIEQETNEEYFEIETHIGEEETYSEIRLEKDGVDGAVEIYIEENGLDAYYEITKEVDGEFTIYYFEYSVGDVSGSIQLTEYIVEGEMIQYFIIEEGDYYNEYTVPENSVVPDDL